MPLARATLKARAFGRADTFRDAPGAAGHSLDLCWMASNRGVREEAGLPGPVAQISGRAGNTYWGEGSGYRSPEEAGKFCVPQIPKRNWGKDSSANCQVSEVVENKSGHGQPLAGDPGAAEVTSTASRAAGPRPREGSRMRVRGVPRPFLPAFPSPHLPPGIPFWSRDLNPTYPVFPESFPFHAVVLVVVLNRPPRLVFSIVCGLPVRCLASSVMRIQNFGVLCINFHSSREERGLVSP